MQFKLFYPLKPQSVNQKFGEKSPVYTNMGLQGHNGIDFYALHGQPIYAAHDGVARYEIDSSGGHGIVIQSTDKFDYGDAQVYFKSISWHLCDSQKEPQYRSPVENFPNHGMTVKAGDLIGYADNTGVSSGNHLHFGIKPVADGEPSGTWCNVAQSNGYLGAIDPAPYFNGLYAGDIKAQKPETKFIFNTDLKYGMTSLDVKQLQIRIGVSQTGYFGPLTLAAMVVYQIMNGIKPVSGYCGIITRTKLNS